MIENITDDQAIKLTRRGVLGGSAAIPFALAVPAVAAEPLHDMGTNAPTAAPLPDKGTASRPGSIVALEGLETLNAIEMEALEAFCACLIPTDDRSPGAREARAAHYIDRALAGPLMNQRGTYAAGLSGLDAYARNTRGQLFARLAPADQDAVMHDLAAGKASGFAGGSAIFFGLVRAHTIEGTFCDPYYGGNANFVGWDLVGYPGLRMMVGPEDQRLVKPKALRESAYSSASMFGRS